MQLQCSELLQSPASECVAALFAQARSSRLQFTTLEKFSEAFLVFSGVVVTTACWSSAQRWDIFDSTAPRSCRSSVSLCCYYQLSPGCLRQIARNLEVSNNTTHTLASDGHACVLALFSINFCVCVFISCAAFWCDIKSISHNKRNNDKIKKPMSVRSPKSSQESVKAVRGLWYQQSMMGRTCEKGRFEPGGEKRSCGAKRAWLILCRPLLLYF